MARSNIRSQKVQGTSGALSEVEVFKKCMRLWHEETHCRSQNVQPTRLSSGELFKLKCSKSARRCGRNMPETHLEVNMYKKNNTFGPLLELEMLKKCTQLYREAHSEVKKHTTFAPILNVQVQVSFFVAGETTTTNSNCNYITIY